MIRTIKQNLAATSGAGVFTPRRGSLRRSRAFSLVEVLVAIAILTIGIIAFFTIFPGGFTSLAIAANTSAASRLAQSELDSLTAGDGASIQQIAAVAQQYTITDSDGSAWEELELDPSYNPETALTKGAGVTLQQTNGFNISNTVTASPAQAIVQAPETLEYVNGERVRISSVNPSSALASCNVMLDFGPLVIPAQDGTATPTVYPDTNTFNSLSPSNHAAFFVHGLPWQAKIGDSDLVTPIETGSSIGYAYADDPDSELSQDRPQYLVDYNAGKIALREPTSGYSQKFVFQVETMPPTASGTPGQVMLHTVLFTANWNQTPPTGPNINNLTFWDPTYNKSLWVSIDGTPDDTGTALSGTWIPGTAKLVRDFQEVSDPTKFTNDPYQFALPAATLGTDPTTHNVSYLGYLSFNPKATTIVDGRGQPLQASVDYIVRNWNTIHEDRTIGLQSNVSSSTANSQNTVTTLRLTLNHLLRVGETDDLGNKFAGIGTVSGNPTDVVVFDLDTFSTLTEVATYTTGSTAPVFTVDYANGAITVYNYTSGSHLRIFYRPATSWGIAPLKAAATYNVVPVSATVTAPTTTGEAVLSVTPSGAGQQIALSFPTCDANRLVQISGTVTFKNADGTTYTTVQAQPQLVTLTLPSGALPGQNPTAVISLPTSQSIPTGATLYNQNLSVTGASLTVRAIFHSGTRWHSRDVTTVAFPSNL